MGKNRRWDFLSRLGFGRKASRSRGNRSDRPFGRSLQMEQLETRELLSVTGSISGSVFSDSDADGFFDANEAGRANWTVELQGVAEDATELGVIHESFLSLENRFASAVATYDSDVLIASPNSQPGMVLRYTGDGDFVEAFRDPVEGGTFGVSMAVFDHYLVVGDPNETVGGVSRAGAVYVFDLTIGNDTPLYTLHKVSTKNEDDCFGYSVAALDMEAPANDEVYIGVPGDDVGGKTDSGGIYRVELIGQTPVPTLISGATAHAGAELGRSLAADFLDGSPNDQKLIVAGAPGYVDELGATGAAFAFDLASSPAVSYSFRGTGSSDFGRSVAISSGYVFVGAPLEFDGDVPRGAVYAYDRSDLTVGATDVVRSTGTDPGDFGRALAVDGDGGFYVSDPYQDVVYYYDALETENPTLYCNPQAESTCFGYAIAVAGDVPFVADPAAVYNDRAPGAAYLFTPSGTIPYENPNQKCSPETTLSGVPGASFQFLSATTYLIIDPSASQNTGSITVYGFGNPITIDDLGDGVPVAGDMLGYDVVKVDETHFLASAPGRTEDSVTSAGAVYLFDATTGNVVQTFRNPSPEPGDRFGALIRVTGDSVLISSMPVVPDPNNSGAVCLFRLNTNGVPSEPTCLGTFMTFANQFGTSLASLGDNLIVGVPEADIGLSNDCGVVYVLSPETGEASLTLSVATGSSDPEDEDNFGECVVTDGEYIVVGAPGRRVGGFDAAGALYIFDSDGTYVRTIQNPNAAENDRFGTSLSVFGDYVLVGAPHDNGGGVFQSGAAYLYDLNSGTLVETFTSSSADAEGLFGWSVCGEGNDIFIGAPGEDDALGDDTGAVYRYTFEGTTWNAIGKVSFPGFSSPGDLFGSSIAMVGDQFLVTARGASLDGSTAEAGKAYLFDRESGNLNRIIQSPNPQPYQGFGWNSIAVRDDKIFVTAAKPQLNAQPGDLNGDHLVGSDDLDIVRANWGQSVTPGDLSAGDPSGDGFVGVDDLNIVRANWGNSLPPSTAGEAYMFDAFSGVLLKTFVEPISAEYGFFGMCAAVVGNEVLIAAPNAHVGVDGAGAVYLFDAKTRTTTTDIDGEYEFSNLDPGTYRVRAIATSEAYTRTAPFDLTGSYWITIEDEEEDAPAPVDTFRLNDFGFYDPTDPGFSCHIISLDGWGYRLAIDPGRLDVDAWTVDWDYQTSESDPNPATEAVDSLFLDYYYTIAPESGEYVVRVKAWADDGEGNFSAIACHEVPVRIEDDLWGIGDDAGVVEAEGTDFIVNVSFNQAVSLAPSAISILDEDGASTAITATAVQQITSDTDPTYSVTLSEIPTAGTYYLKFNPELITSSENQVALNQDGDDLSGEETDDVFRVKFIVEESEEIETPLGITTIGSTSVNGASVAIVDVTAGSGSLSLFLQGATSYTVAVVQGTVESSLSDASVSIATGNSLEWSALGENGVLYATIEVADAADTSRTMLQHICLVRSDVTHASSVLPVPDTEKAWESTTGQIADLDLDQEGYFQFTAGFGSAAYCLSADAPPEATIENGVLNWSPDGDDGATQTLTIIAYYAEYPHLWASGTFTVSNIVPVNDAPRVVSFDLEDVSVDGARLVGIVEDDRDAFEMIYVRLEYPYLHDNELTSSMVVVDVDPDGSFSIPLSSLYFTNQAPDMVTVTATAIEQCPGATLSSLDSDPGLFASIPTPSSPTLAEVSLELVSPFPAVGTDDAMRTDQPLIRGMIDYDGPTEGLLVKIEYYNSSDWSDLTIVRADEFGSFIFEDASVALPSIGASSPPPRQYRATIIGLSDGTDPIQTTGTWEVHYRAPAVALSSESGFVSDWFQGSTITGDVSSEGDGADKYAYVIVQIDYTDDGLPDVEATTNNDGDFSLVLTEETGTLTSIDVRVLNPNSSRTPEWQNITITNDSPSADSVPEIALSNDSGACDYDFITAVPTLSGRISSAANMDLPAVQFDFDQDGSPDGFALAMAQGDYEYMPIGLSTGQVTVSYRCVDLADTEGTYSWSSEPFVFYYDPASEPAPSIVPTDSGITGLEYFSLLFEATNGPGDDADDTGIPWLVGQVAYDADMGDVAVEIEVSASGGTYRGRAFPDENGQFIYAVPTWLGSGTPLTVSLTPVASTLDGGIIRGDEYTGSFYIATSENELVADDAPTLTNDGTSGEGPLLQGSVTDFMDSSVRSQGDMVVVVEIGEPNASGDDFETGTEIVSLGETLVDDEGNYSIALRENPLSDSIAVRITPKFRLQGHTATGVSEFQTFSPFSTTVDSAPELAADTIVAWPAGSSCSSILIDGGLEGVDPGDIVRFELDYNQTATASFDDVADVTISADANGEFSQWIEVNLSSTLYIQARALIRTSDADWIYTDWSSELEVSSSVTADTFTVSNVRLLHDTRQDTQTAEGDRDAITTNPTLVGQVDVSIEPHEVQVLVQRFADGEWVDDGSTSVAANGAFYYLPNEYAEGPNLYRFVVRPSHYESAPDGTFSWDCATKCGFILESLSDTLTSLSSASDTLALGCAFATSDNPRKDPTIDDSFLLMSGTSVSFGSAMNYVAGGFIEASVGGEVVGTTQCDADGDFTLTPSLEFDSSVSITLKAKGYDFLTGEIVTLAEQTITSFSFSADASVIVSAYSFSIETDDSERTLTGELSGTTGGEPSFAEIDWNGDGIPDDSIQIKLERDYTTGASYDSVYRFTYTVPSDVGGSVYVRPVEIMTNRLGYGTWSSAISVGDALTDDASIPVITEIIVFDQTGETIEISDTATPEIDTASFFVNGAAEIQGEGRFFVQFDWAEGDTDAGLDGEPELTLELDVDGGFMTIPQIDEAGTYWFEVRGVFVDPTTGIETYGDWGNAFSLQINETTLPRVTDLALVYPDEDDALSTPIPTITGTVTNLDDLAYATIEVDVNGDKLPDAVVIADGDGQFVYTASHLTAGSTPTLNFRAVSSDLHGSNRGEWSKFSFTYRDYATPALVSGSISLVNDNGTSTSDHETTDPTFTGTMDFDSALDDGWIEFDFDEDGTVDATARFGADGKFTVTPDLEPGTYFVKSRGVGFADGVKYQGSFPTETTGLFSFTVLADYAPEVTDLAPDTEDTSLLVGAVEIDGIAVAAAVDVDVDADGNYDMTVYSDEKGHFEFKPVALVDGELIGLAASTTAAVTVRPRLGAGTGSLLGSSETFTFDYSPSGLAAIPSVSLGLLYDTGNSDTDGTTADATLEFLLDREESVAGMRVECYGALASTGPWYVCGSAVADESGRGLILPSLDLVGTPSSGYPYYFQLVIYEWNLSSGVETPRTASIPIQVVFDSSADIAGSLRDDDGETAGIQATVTVDTLDIGLDPATLPTGFPTLDVGEASLTVWNGFVENDGPLDGLRVEFDYDADGEPDDWVYSYVDESESETIGRFTHVPNGFVTDSASYSVRIRVGELNDEATEPHGFEMGEWTSVTLTSTATASPVIGSFLLLNDTGTYDNDGQTADPTVVGQVNPIDSVSSGFSVEISVYEDGESTPLYTEVIETDASGRFEYTPHDLAVGTTYDICASAFLIDSVDGERLSSSALTVQDVLLTAPETNGAPAFAEDAQQIAICGLANDTGVDGDGTTCDPTIEGQIENDGNLEGIVVNIEIDDPSVETGRRRIGTTTTAADGTFSFLPENLPFNKQIVLYVTPREFDPLSGTYLEPESPEQVSLTLKPWATVEIVSIALDAGQIDPSHVTDPTIHGSIQAASAGSDGVRLGNVVIEFDHDDDGNPDGSVLTEADGSFEYLPLGLPRQSTTPITLRARIRQWDAENGCYTDTGWSTMASPFTSITLDASIPILDEDPSEIEEVESANAQADTVAEELVAMILAEQAWSGNINIGLGTFTPMYQPELDVESVDVGYAGIVAETSPFALIGSPSATSLSTTVPTELSGGSYTASTYSVTINGGVVTAVNIDVDVTNCTYTTTYVFEETIPGGTATHTVTVNVTDLDYGFDSDFDSSTSSVCTYEETLSYTATVTETVILVYTLLGTSVVEEQRFETEVQYASSYGEDIVFGTGNARSHDFDFSESVASELVFGLSGDAEYVGTEAHRAAASEKWSSGDVTDPETPESKMEFAAQTTIAGDYVVNAALPGETTVYEYALAASGGTSASVAMTLFTEGSGTSLSEYTSFAENSEHTYSALSEYTLALSDKFDAFRLTVADDPQNTGEYLISAEVGGHSEMESDASLSESYNVAGSLQYRPENPEPGESSRGNGEYAYESSVTAASWLLTATGSPEGITLPRVPTDPDVLALEHPVPQNHDYYVRPGW